MTAIGATPPPRLRALFDSREDQHQAGEADHQEEQTEGHVKNELRRPGSCSRLHPSVLPATDAAVSWPFRSADSVKRRGGKRARLRGNGEFVSDVLPQGKQGRRRLRITLPRSAFDLIGALLIQPQDLPVGIVRAQDAFVLEQDQGVMKLMAVGVEGELDKVELG